MKQEQKIVTKLPIVDNVTAGQLKKIGFAADGVLSYYLQDGQLVHCPHGCFPIEFYAETSTVMAAPTVELALRWFRTFKRIHVEFTVERNGLYRYMLRQTDGKAAYLSAASFANYDAAADAALQMAINKLTTDENYNDLIRITHIHSLRLHQANTATRGGKRMPHQYTLDELIEQAEREEQDGN